MASLACALGASACCRSAAGWSSAALGAASVRTRQKTVLTRLTLLIDLPCLQPDRQENALLRFRCGSPHSDQSERSLHKTPPTEHFHFTQQALPGSKRQSV